MSASVSSLKVMNTIHSQQQICPPAQNQGTLKSSRWSNSKPPWSSPKTKASEMVGCKGRKLNESPWCRGDMLWRDLLSNWLFFFGCHGSHGFGLTSISSFGHLWGSCNTIRTCSNGTYTFTLGFPMAISHTSQPKSAAAWRQRPLPKRCDCPKICPAEVPVAKRWGKGFFIARELGKANWSQPEKKGWCPFAKVRKNMTNIYCTSPKIKKNRSMVFAT